MDFVSKLNLKELNNHFKIVNFAGKTVSTLRTIQTVLTILTIILTIYRVFKMLSSQ